RHRVEAEGLALSIRAIKSHGNAEIRHAAIDNAMHRQRQNREIPHHSYRVLEGIASRCKWRYRYHFETAETLGYFSAIDGSNLRRILKPLIEQRAVASLALPRKDG